MTTALELFSELGFEIDSYRLNSDDHKSCAIRYQNKIEGIYIFFYTNKSYHIHGFLNSVFPVIDMKLHSAIKQQINELGWNE